MMMKIFYFLICSLYTIVTFGLWYNVGFVWALIFAAGVGLMFAVLLHKDTAREPRVSIITYTYPESGPPQDWNKYTQHVEDTEDELMRMWRMDSYKGEDR